MKFSSRIVSLICFNFWYVPLLVFLIGIKISLVSFLLTPTNFDLQPAKAGKWGQVLHNEHKVKSKRNKRNRTTTPVPVEVAWEWETLRNLENARISASDANRTDKDSVWLVFNRVPRSGGNIIVRLLEELERVNRFSHQSHEYRTPWPRFLLEQEQESLVSWFEYQHLPKSYDRHFFFVNFTRYQKFTREKPIYINLLRDPVSRMRSEFITRRRTKELAAMEISRREKERSGSGKAWYQMSFDHCVLNEEEECRFENGSADFTLSVPFFCGQFNSCVAINDKWGLQMAKFTMERQYSVVGVLERMDQTLSVLESYVPKFFSGVTEIYSQGNFRAKKERPVARKVREKLETKLHAEMDMYRFAVGRLALQYERVRNTL